MNKAAGKQGAVPRLRFPGFGEAWKHCELGDVATFRSGGTPSKQKAAYWNGDIPWISAASMYSTVLDSSNLMITQLAVNDGATIAAAGSLLILVRGSMLYNRVPMGIAARDVSFNQDVKSLSIDPDIDVYFLLQQLMAFEDRIPVDQTGIGAGKIETDELKRLRIYKPHAAEQQKIADCLSSLDACIGAESRKLDAIKAHKQGLMQQLFPAEGETVPRLRFPEFIYAPEWCVDAIGKLFETSSGGTPDRNVRKYWGGNIPWITTSLIDFNVIHMADEFISDVGLNESSAKLFPKNTLLVAMYGQGKTRGKAALLGFEASTNQACAAILPSRRVDPFFAFLSLCGRYDEIRGLSNSGGQENLSQGLIRELPFRYPSDVAEQRKIVDCLSYIGTLITTQSHKVATLKQHKQGLMQGLFPSMDAAVHERPVDA